MMNRILLDHFKKLKDIYNKMEKMTHDEAIDVLVNLPKRYLKDYQLKALDYAIENLKSCFVFESGCDFGSNLSDQKEPQPFKIEVGGEYQTRDGREVRIYATDGAGNLCVHGAVFKEGDWDLETWTIDGKCFKYIKSDNNLIPKPKKPLSFTKWVLKTFSCNFNGLGDNEMNRAFREYTQYLNDFKL